MTDRDTEEATTLVYAIRAIEEKRLRGEETASVSHAQQLALVLAAFGRIARSERVRCATTDYLGGRRGPS